MGIPSEELKSQVEDVRPQLKIFSKAAELCETALKDQIQRHETSCQDVVTQDILVNLDSWQDSTWKNVEHGHKKLENMLFDSRLENGSQISEIVKDSKINDTKDVSTVRSNKNIQMFNAPSCVEEIFVQPAGKEIHLKPDKPPRPLKKSQTLFIHGMVIPTSIHACHQRVKDELKIVTATKRLQIDELVEVRMMEVEMAKRAKFRKLSEQKEELNNLLKAKLQQPASVKSSRHARDIADLSVSNEAQKKSNLRTSALQTISTQSKVSPMTKRKSPKQQHKRQTSDPMFAKFSPIEEDRDIESILKFNSQTLPAKSGRMGSGADFYGSKPIRLGTSLLMNKMSDADNGARSAPKYLSMSSQGLDPDYFQMNLPHGSDGRMPGSASVSSLPIMYKSDITQQPCGALSFGSYSLAGAARDHAYKEKKLHQLQIEIEKRRRHLNDMLTGQCSDSLYAPPCNVPPIIESPLHEPVNRGGNGVIKPIDYQINPEKYYVQRNKPPNDHTKFADGGIEDGHVTNATTVYSSRDYLTHRSERSTPTHQQSGLNPDEFNWQPQIAGTDPHHEEKVSLRHHPFVDTLQYSESEESFMYCPANYCSSSRDSGVSSSSMVGTDAYAHKGSDREQPSPAFDDMRENYRPHSGRSVAHDEGFYPSNIGAPRSVEVYRQDDAYINSCFNAQSYPTRIPESNHPSNYAPMFNSYIDVYDYPIHASSYKYSPLRTPPMPILDDVQSRSRSRLRDIGCRPLSDNFEKYFQAEGEINFNLTSNFSASKIF